MADALAKSTPDDDNRCGMVTDLVRTGDVLLRLRRVSEAKAAYSAALSKSDPDAAKKMRKMFGPGQVDQSVRQAFKCVG